MTEITTPNMIQLARQHHRAGRLPQAQQLCRQILDREPRNAEALHLLGVIARQSGKNKVAIQLIRRALSINPSVATYHNSLGESWYAVNRMDQAISSYQKALQLEPDFALAHHNLGAAYAKQNQVDKARTCYEKAIQLRPNFANSYYNLGNAHRKQGDFEKAVVFYQKAIQLKPSFPLAYSNLGVVLKTLGKVNEAINCFDQALQIKPNYAEAHWNKAIALLLSGNFPQGWAEYEWRWQYKDFSSPKRDFPQPLWDGSDLSGRTILLHAEQGFGDTLQFIRYVPLVSKRGGRVILECQPELKSLLLNLQGVEKVVAQSELLPEFDVQSPLLSLPLAFGTTLQTIPVDVPYLRADPKKVEHWRQRLGDSVNIERSSSSPSRHSSSRVLSRSEASERGVAASGGQASVLNVGLVWARKPKPGPPSRSSSWKTFVPLAQVRDVAFYSLQQGEAAKEARDRPPEMVFVDWSDDLNDFADTAALVANLDLIISIDTSVAHLAGALGKPVWTLLPFAPDWRWLLQREDSPWYPTMRLFRQPAFEDWDSVMQRVTIELEEKVRRQMA